MSTIKASKINHLLSSQPTGVVFVSSWLTSQGYSLDLQKRYRSSQWLQSIGKGAMIRAGDPVHYEGAVYALQQQLGLSVHPAGRTALSLLGKGHYLELDQATVTLFGKSNETLPAWCRNKDWGVKLDYHQSSFLPSDVGMIDVELKTFSIKVSSSARGLMECLYLASAHQDLQECLELMEGMNNLRPDNIQMLLEQCSSIKVKRLFLYLAEKVGHDWLQYLNMTTIDLGKGKRSLVKEGTYVAKYQITVPKVLENYGK